ncbi:MAG: DMT family transporter [Pseudomonadota bacterium]
MAEVANRGALHAAAWMTGAIVSFSTMAVAGRELGDVHDTFEIMLFRSLTGIVIVVGVAGLLGRLHEVRAQHLPLHAVRNLAHFTGQNLWFYAVTVAPLTQVFALEFTTPIWVTLLAPLFLGEKLTRTRAFVAAMGFVGILIVTRPWSEPLEAGVLTAAASAIGFAATTIATKRLTRVATVTCILFWLTVFQSGFGLVAVFYDGTVTWPTLATLPLLIYVACAGLFAHLCITNALLAAPASVVAPLDFLRLPLIAVVGMVVYNEPLVGWVFVGALVIFTANTLNIRAEARRASDV